MDSNTRNPPAAPDVNFGFPFAPYGIQRAFMTELRSTIQQKRVGIFESPTGTGKTLSLICGTLSWLHGPDAGDDVDDPTSVKAGGKVASPKPTPAAAAAGKAEEPSWFADHDELVHERNLQQRREERRIREAELMTRLAQVRLDEEQETRDTAAQLAAAAALPSVPQKQRNDASDAVSRGHVPVRKRQGQPQQPSSDGNSSRHRGLLRQDAAAASGFDDTESELILRDLDSEDEEGSRDGGARPSSPSSRDGRGGRGSGATHSRHHRPSLHDSTGVSTSAIRIADELRSSLLGAPLSSSIASGSALHVASRKLGFSSQRGGAAAAASSSYAPGAPPSPRDATEEYLRPKLFFVSRTHSQLAQFVREVKRTAYGPFTRVVALGSRRLLCVNEEVTALGSDARINERCAELQEEARGAGGGQGAKGQQVRDDSSGGAGMAVGDCATKAEPSSGAPSTAEGKAPSTAEGKRVKRSGGDGVRGSSAGVDTTAQQQPAPERAHGCPCLSSVPAPQSPRPPSSSSSSRVTAGGKCGGAAPPPGPPQPPQELFRDRLLAGGGRDIEEAAALGRRMGTCAYYGSRRAVAAAHVVALPYSMMLHRETREALGLDLRGSVVIMDEGHNIIDAVNSVHSAAVSVGQLATAHGAVRAYLERYRGRMSPANVVLCTQLGDVLMAFIRFARGGGEPERRGGGVGGGRSGAVMAAAASAPSLKAAAAAPPAQGAATFPVVAEDAADASASTSAERPPRGSSGEDGEVPLAANGKTLPLPQRHAPTPSAPVTPRTAPATTSPPCPAARTPSAFLYAAGIDNINLWRLVRYIEAVELLRKLRGFAEAGLLAAAGLVTPVPRSAEAGFPPAAPASHPASHPVGAAAEGSGGSSGGAPGVVAALQASYAFLCRLTTGDDDGRVVVVQPPSLRRGTGGAGQAAPSSGAPTQLGNSPLASLKFFNLNPSLHFRDIVESARSVILAGGTMSPVTDVASQLFGFLPPSRPLTVFSCGHIIPPDHLAAFACKAGPSGLPWDFRFASRGSAALMDELGRALLNIAALAPAGVVVFLPSYDYERALMEHWSRGQQQQRQGRAGQQGQGGLVWAGGGSQHSSPLPPSHSAPHSLAPSPKLPHGSSVFVSSGIGGARGSVDVGGYGDSAHGGHSAPAAGPISPTGSPTGGAAFMVMPAYRHVDGRGAALAAAAVRQLEVQQQLSQQKQAGGGGSPQTAAVALHGPPAAAAAVPSTAAKTSGTAAAAPAALVEVAGLPCPPGCVLAQLNARKRVFREPRTAGDMEAVLREYGAAASSSKWRGGSGPDASPGGGGAGALLFAVVGGKMSEGINFSDDLARCVVVVGLPFPNPGDPELREQMAFLDRQQGQLASAPSHAPERQLQPQKQSGAGGAPSSSLGETSTSLWLPATTAAAGAAAPHPSSSSSGLAPTASPPGTAGRAYYENLCMRAVNQSIGRSIRHSRDFSTIVLLDERYATQRIRSKLPKWIGARLSDHGTWGSVLAGIGAFFKDKRVPAAAQMVPVLAGGAAS